MAKKVFERIFSTIQIVINVVFGGITLVQLGIVLFDTYATIRSWDLCIAQVGLMVGWNLINGYIRKLIRNY